MFLAGPLPRPFLDTGRYPTKAALTAVGSASPVFRPGTTLRVSGAATATFHGVAAALWSAAGVGTASFIGTPGGKLMASGSATVTFTGVGAGKLVASGAATAQFGGSTAWDVMLKQDNSPIAYFAELEPWVLADRS
jgi:hypothetical protein